MMLTGIPVPVMKNQLGGLLFLSLCCCCCQITAVWGAWQRGRATYYGGPSTALDSSFGGVRGQGAFGILSWGSCGYTNGDGSLGFPQDAIAALADGNADYPGSCGRCYEIRCISGTVFDSPSKPIRIINGTFDGDAMRPYLAAISTSYKDTSGRPWPGNPKEMTEGVLYTKCWDPSKTLRIRIADSCPCIQVLPDGAPTVKKGGEVRRQEWCCGGEHHFDLSYYAFESLAHPTYGAMMLEYRPVDCVSGAELPLSPGYISRNIFKDTPQPGWSWFPYKGGIGPYGSGATCASVEKGGGVSFSCRDCFKPGYQPFANASGVEFWVKQDDDSGQVPPIKVVVYNDASKQYCGQEPVLGGGKALAAGYWAKINIPMDAFKCGNGLVELDQLTTVSFQDVGSTQGLSFCLADVKILG